MMDIDFQCMGRKEYIIQIFKKGRERQAKRKAS